jgi:hypothetical protein
MLLKIKFLNDQVFDITSFTGKGLFRSNAAISKPDTD